MKGAAGLVRASDWARCATWHDFGGFVGRHATYVRALCKRNRFGKRRFV